MIPGSANSLLLATAAGAGGYAIERSLRFNSADSAYLSRTPASAGNRKTWTWAGWVKRSAISDGHLFTCTSGTTDSTYLRLWITGNRFYLGGYGTNFRGSTAYYRDPSAWYHFVCAVDTTQATGANRIKMYVNGIQITSFAESSDPVQNADLGVNQNTAHRIGAETNTAGFFNGLLADIHFCDGTAYDASAFGEFDANGIWQPKRFAGVYGSQGWHLDFADNSTTAALGTDTSGAGNNWTVNNISVAAGAGNDSLVDVPTNGSETDTGAGGEVRGNYCTLNPLISTSSTLSNGNLDYASTATYQSSYGTIAARTGKWYWEGTVGTFATDALIGVSSSPFSTATYAGGSATSWGYEGAVGRIYNNATFSAYGATFGAGDIIGVAFDADTGKLWFAKNGTWQASGNPAAGTNPAVTLTTGIDYFFGVSAGNGGTWSCNWGARPFAYTAPSGFKALCTANLPAPVVTKPSTVFDVKLYTGNGSTQTISGLNMSPDLVWTKARNTNYSPQLIDIIRGGTTVLFSDRTQAEGTYSSITSFNSDGYTVSTELGVNGSGDSFAAWCWDAGSSTVTNTQGSITSQVRANASAGFSIVTYTGTGANATVGHGLGVAPSMLIVKSRNDTYGWKVYHSSTGNGNSLVLNSTAASASDPAAWNSTSPTSSVFSIGNGTTNASSSTTYVAYCFAPVAGYSSGFSYTGNGSTDGVFQFLGFRPRLILLKRTDTTGNWTLIDTAREGYNVDNDPLYPNLSDAEGTADLLDITSNGFKLRSTDASVNANAGTYVGFAWAETPFAYSRAR